MQNRAMKAVTTGVDTVFTFYVRDAQGNVLGIYTRTTAATPTITWSEQYLYGSGRLGSVQPGVSWTAASTYTGPHYMGTKRLLSGQKRYEIANHLGNVLTTIGDRKIPVDGAVADNTAEYYTAVVHSAQDYYPFGMEMPGRTFVLGGGYRYGLNGQEASDLGSGQTTAKFWEYDTRLGRRWNVDPKYFSHTSRYATFGDNPLYFTDRNGDFKTKFGAKMYQLFHGGEILKANDHENNGKHKNEYFVSKRVSCKVDPSEAGVAYERVFDWGKDKGGVQKLWNSSAMRKVIPDYISITYSTTTTMGGMLSGYTTGGVNFYLVTRGKAPGIYYNGSGGGGGAVATGLTMSTEVAKSYNFGWYLDDIEQFDPEKILGGEEVNASLSIGAGIPITGDIVQFGMNLEASQGYGDHGNPTTRQWGFGTAISVAPPKMGEIKASVGKAKASDAVPIWKF
jgi:hypothetical protein